MSDHIEQVDEQEADPHQHTKRDAETQIALGSFISFISIFVLIGTFWASDTKAMVVNLTAGTVLLGVGIIMTFLGVTKRKKLAS